MTGPHPGAGHASQLRRTPARTVSGRLVDGVHSLRGLSGHLSDGTVEAVMHTWASFNDLVGARTMSGHSNHSAEEVAMEVLCEITGSSFHRSTDLRCDRHVT